MPRNVPCDATVSPCVGDTERWLLQACPQVCCLPLLRTLHAGAAARSPVGRASLMCAFRCPDRPDALQHCPPARKITLRQLWRLGGPTCRSNSSSTPIQASVRYWQVLEVDLTLLQARSSRHVDPYGHPAAGLSPGPLLRPLAATDALQQSILIAGQLLRPGR